MLSCETKECVGALAKTAGICHGAVTVAASCCKSSLGTNTCSVALLASEMDADNICFNEAEGAGVLLGYFFWFFLGVFLVFGSVGM